MKRTIPLLVMLACVLSACLDTGTVTVAPNPYSITPSRLPRILSPTPNLIFPTSSGTPPPATASQASTLTSTSEPLATITETPTSTGTATSASAPLTIQLLGCDTSIDIVHGMGEVTNAYVTLANTSGPDLTSVCATLSAADESRVHPDKMICIPSLPTRFQVTLKLTIDTTFRANTIVQIQVTTVQGITVTVDGQACTDIGLFKPAPEAIGVLHLLP